MPIQCDFVLNRQNASYFSCIGITPVEAFSGKDRWRDNPDATDKVNGGAIPKGIYYLIDRQSGGILGWLYDWYTANGWGTTDRTRWFTLWNPRTGDTTMINGIKRGQFRLHPMGPGRLSDGCITVVNPLEFSRLQAIVRSHKPDLPVPGATFKAYGTVTVR
jgi:hypothetical protein